MSTERKPGSRGIRETSSLERSNPANRLATPTGKESDDERRKGTTRTPSPKSGFKKRPRK